MNRKIRDPVTDSRPDVHERRRGQRQVTLMRVGLVHTTDGKDFCLVRNLSMTGLMARVYRGFKPGENVQVELKSDYLLAGEVVWAQDQQIGVRFRTAIDLEDVLSVQWDGETSLRPRLPRLELCFPAIVRQGAEPVPIQVRDISHRGAKIRTRGSVVKPAPVVLALPYLPSIHAVVRWTREEQAGLVFNECLPFEMLARCIDESRRPRPSADAAADVEGSGDVIVSNAQRVA